MNVSQESRVMHRAIRHRPDIAVRGDGLTLTLVDGREIFDARGGAAAACLGHGNRGVADIIGAQASTLAYTHTGFFSTEPAEALADWLLKDEPGGLSQAYFVSSGSEAMEAALKLARQYFVEKGEPRRTRFIARCPAAARVGLSDAAAHGRHRTRRKPAAGSPVRQGRSKAGASALFPSPDYPVASLCLHGG